jgi:hypothetical protein
MFEPCGDFRLRWGAALLVLEVADGTLDCPSRLASGPTDGVERANGIEDGASDSEDRVRLEGRSRLGLVGVDGSQQAQNSGLHGVFVVEEARDGDAQAAQPRT